MRSSGNARSSLRAALAIAALGAGLGIAQPAPVRRTGNGYVPTPPKRDTPLDREIADWNASVEARRWAKAAQRASGESDGN